MTQGAAHESHFEDLAQQVHAARLGVWLLIASEILFFGALFGLYAGLRAEVPAGFEAGAHEMATAIGTTNTFVLLTSSLTVALAYASLKLGRFKVSLALVGATVALALVFLVLKGIEYADHLRHGLGPAMPQPADKPPGMAVFITLYWMMTGLHALHVIGGLCVFAWVSRGIWAGHVSAARPHRFELVAIYWHFVDLVWIFLWPTFYLIHGG